MIECIRIIESATILSEKAGIEVREYPSLLDQDVGGCLFCRLFSRGSRLRNKSDWVLFRWKMSLENVKDRKMALVKALMK